MGKLRKRVVAFSVVYVLVAAAGMWAVRDVFFETSKPRDVAYSELLTRLRAGELSKVQLREREIYAELRASASAGAAAAGETGAKRAILAQRLPGVEDERLVEELERHGVEFSGHVEDVPWWQQLLVGWLLPLSIIVMIYAFVVWKLRKSGGPLILGGKESVKIYDENEHGKVTFADVAGVDEAKGELTEIVDFLKNPTKYDELGARIPKGVLLVGPPGTGKTLLAKAVAGEANVHFFSMSAPAFVEMFVGVGAARMRNLFKQARERAPCIVFIDEIDAIGKSRSSAGSTGGNDEREQTLNQLLVEMDGFDASSGVIMMAATNRPEILDPALLRAGRFDRTVVVDRPNVAEREAILEVHARRIRLAANVHVKVVAQRTPGMVGADLANVVNEAALAAARRGSKEVDAGDFEEAVDRAQLGLKKQKKTMNEEERTRVAYHEAGHTLVALSVEKADPVHRVTIIPRSIGALGATLQLPTEDRYLMTKQELLDRITVMLGGRVAEELVHGEVSTGAENDLERATGLARQMVCRFGMSDRVGLVTFTRAGGRFLDGDHGEERGCSEETARLIDSEIKAILDAEHARAVEILRRRRPILQAITERLLERETVERDELIELLRDAKDERAAQRAAELFSERPGAARSERPPPQPLAE